MSIRSLNGTDFTAMVIAGAEQLGQHAEHVNSLNVFPVPDGDTGTNMNLTMTAGVAEIKRKSSASIGEAAGILSKGLLMGARGNSGVILSQLFRGFSRSAAAHEELNTIQFAAALQNGVDAAYKAVVKPVEGTILTVAKEAAKHATYYARRTNDITELMNEVLLKAKEALAMTPEMLPVLKQVGVVDSGGQGLVYIYEGFMEVLLQGEGGARPSIQKESVPSAAVKPSAQPEPITTKAAQVIAPEMPLSAQARLETEDIEFLYDMEFFINRELGENAGTAFDDETFRKALSINGDSIIIIADDEVIKVHVHSKTPGDVLNLALKYGEITQIHILNMREQHRDLLTAGMDGAASPDLFADIPHEKTSTLEEAVLPADEMAPYGFIAVSSGDGIAEIFKSLGVDIVLSGGQTMNPSTEDFVKAVRSIAAEQVFILPNNSNIVLAAEQARELLEDERRITVIPSKTIPQGMAAAFAFQEDESADTNRDQMLEAISRVQSGQVTHAVRDTQYDELDIKAGHYIGIHNSKIVATDESMLRACEGLLAQMLESGDEVVTILEGEEADPEVTGALAAWLQEQYPAAEVEVHHGGQPVYYYLFSVES
ncbi:DAK2 domain-containing protein [Paenibacillus silvae]|uniref:DAK2 domain-containing protein n=1 Tax=Paenibacillus TaxID=44249 RepID=UPI001C11226D|nr:MULTISPECIES: DAK2 domain-containing protein [Paenibacillus]MBU5354384.1 DAK2 domain-containing protein [Paenibacillus barcinonensis]MDM5276646.1 DAK2 domain-containing protein [Paenibacillus silvae]